MLDTATNDTYNFIPKLKENNIFFSTFNIYCIVAYFYDN